MSNNNIEMVYNLHLHDDSNFNGDLEYSAEQINKLLEKLPDDIRNDLDAAIGEYAYFNQLLGVEIGLTHSAVGVL